MAEQTTSEPTGSCELSAYFPPLTLVVKGQANQGSSYEVASADLAQKLGLEPAVLWIGERYLKIIETSSTLIRILL